MESPLIPPLFPFLAKQIPAYFFTAAGRPFTAHAAHASRDEQHPAAQRRVRGMVMLYKPPIVPRDEFADSRRMPAPNAEAKENKRCKKRQDMRDVTMRGANQTRAPLRCHASTRADHCFTLTPSFTKTITFSSGIASPQVVRVYA